MTCRETTVEFHNSIYQYALDNPNATTNEIAKEFYTSPSTVKRVIPTWAEKMQYYRDRVTELERELKLRENIVIVNRNVAIDILSRFEGFDKIVVLVSK